MWFEPVVCLETSADGITLGVPNDFAAISFAMVRAAAMLSHQMNQEQYRRIGISPGLIRVSVGIEPEQDLISDFEQALNSA
jgi:cystathionine beta-lyase/cystathionine gamma-synthase